MIYLDTPSTSEKTHAQSTYMICLKTILWAGTKPFQFPATITPTKQFDIIFLFIIFKSL